MRLEGVGIDNVIMGEVDIGHHDLLDVGGKKIAHQTGVLPGYWCLYGFAKDEDVSSWGRRLLLYRGWWRRREHCFAYLWCLIAK